MWDFGNEFEVTAGRLTCGLTPGLENGGDPTKQYQKVIQAFDMKALLAREIDAAEAMIYNEYAQVLEATDPTPASCTQPDQLNVINWNDYRHRDAPGRDLRPRRMARPGTATATSPSASSALRSRAGSTAATTPDDCVQYTTDAGSQLGAGHQKWMMNEVNALVWPSPIGVGMIDPVFWQQTVKVAKNAGVIKSAPIDRRLHLRHRQGGPRGHHRRHQGRGFTKGTVEVTPGGN